MFLKKKLLVITPIFLFVPFLMGVTTDQKFSIEDLVFERQETETSLFKNQTQPILITSTYLEDFRRESIVVVPKMVWPVDEQKIDVDYGYRVPSCGACSSYHEAVDFSRPIGTPVYASMDGLISQLQYSGEYGLHIYIEHIAVINNKSERWMTVYAHLKDGSIPDSIVLGSVVKAGDFIGEIGETGLATGTHLHFELRVEGEKVDPEKYLKMYGN